MDSTANSAMAPSSETAALQRGDSRYLWPMRLLAVWLLVGLLAAGMKSRAFARNSAWLTGEAMAKRGGPYNSGGNGWEWFRLSFTPHGRAKIAARGEAEVANFLGSCQGCHTRVAPTHDLVCEFVIGANGLGLTDTQLTQLQASDPRCKKKP